MKGKRILLTHVGPCSSNKQLNPDAMKERLGRRAQEVKADVVVCGQTHRPFAHEVEDVLFVNPGSVGAPSDGNPQASYATLAFKQKDVQVHHFRLEYDVDRVVSAIHDNGLPEVFAQMFLKGLDLEAAMEETAPPQPPD